MNRIQAEEIKQAMGGWLSELAPWDVFATWTFSRPVQVSGAMYWAQRHLERLRKMTQVEPYAFVGVERGHSGGLVHLHALVGNVGYLPASCDHYLPAGQWGAQCCLRHAWPCGYARVLPYDPQQGASYYVSKYCTKRLAEWELFGFPAAPNWWHPNPASASPAFSSDVTIVTDFVLTSAGGFAVKSLPIELPPLDPAIESVRRSEVKRRY